jgi:hypothetical protein
MWERIGRFFKEWNMPQTFVIYIFEHREKLDTIYGGNKSIYTNKCHEKRWVIPYTKKPSSNFIFQEQHLSSQRIHRQTPSWL